MKNWYALFVRTGYESRLQKNIQSLFLENDVIPFIPVVERIIKLSGLVKKETKNMFPGYLFIDTDMDCVEFNSLIHRAKPFLQEIIRVIRYGDAFDIIIRPAERELLIALLNKEHCWEASKGFIKGDKVYVMEGPLTGMESIIRKIDRHKRKAVIEMNLLGDIRQVTVALEIVAKL